MRGVFDEVTVCATDPVASARFYRAVLAPLGLEPTGEGGATERFAGFSVSPAGADRPATRGLHIGFVAPSEIAIREFWQAGVDAGYRSDGSPGPRPEYSPDYYGAFLLDPDGNSIEAARHGRLRADGGPVDHLWVRVADVAASKAFYLAVARQAGFELVADTAELARFRGAHGGSLTVVRGEPRTQGICVEFSFPAPLD